MNSALSQQESDKRKTGNPLFGGLPVCSSARVASGGAAGPRRTAAGTAAAGTEVDGTVDLESVLLEIHLDGVHFLHEILVDHVSESLDFIHVIGVFRLIQSHGQRGAASAALVEKDPYGCNVFAFEVLGDLLGCRFSYLDHENLLEKIRVTSSGWAEGI